MASLTLRIPDSLERQLTAASKERGISKSDIDREAIERDLRVEAWRKLRDQFRPHLEVQAFSLRKMCCGAWTKSSENSGRFQPIRRRKCIISVDMNLSTLNFCDQGPELIWREGPLSQVLYRVGNTTIRSYCQICVDSISTSNESPHSCVIFWVSWQNDKPEFIVSWDLFSTNRTARLSKPCVDIPMAVVEVLKSFRTPQSVSKWLEEWDGVKPPNYYWLSAIADFWSCDTKKSLDNIEKYIEHFKKGSEMFTDGLELMMYIKKRV